MAKMRPLIHKGNVDVDVTPKINFAELVVTSKKILEQPLPPPKHEALMRLLKAAEDLCKLG